jgi:hypothetical protein
MSKGMANGDLNLRTTIFEYYNDLSPSKNSSTRLLVATASISHTLYLYPLYFILMFLFK